MESEHRLWTDKWVHLTDWLGSPQTTKVDAEGMDLYLATKQEPVRPGQPAKKQAGPAITGAEKILLRSSVSMTLYVAPDSGLLSNGKDPARPSAQPVDVKVAKDPSLKPDAGSTQPVTKDKVIILTPGPFSYDLTKDFAQFDIPAHDAHQTSKFPEVVHLERQHELPSGEANGTITRLENQLAALLAYGKSMFHREAARRQDQTQKRQEITE